MYPDIDLLFLEYKNNIKDSIKYNELIRHPSILDSWSMNVIKRSNSLRHAYKNNEMILGRIKEDLSLGLDEEKASYYYEKVYSLYYDAIDDYGIIKLIADYLIIFYSAIKDYDKLAILYLILGFETLECFNRNPFYAKKSFEYYKKAISLQEHYNEMKDSSARLAIFKAYYNIIGINAIYVPEVKLHIFDYYDDAIKLWDSVENEDKNDPSFIKINEEIRGNILSVEDFLDGLDEKSVNRFIDIALKWDYKKDISGIWFLAHLKAQYLAHKRSLNEIIEELKAYYYSLPDLDINDIEPELILKIFNAGCDLLDYYKESDLENKEYEIEKIINRTDQFLYSIPFDYENNMIDFLCVTWFNVALPYLKDKSEKEKLLTHLIVERQLFTYLHSVMVSKISKEIALNILNNSPDFFIGFMNLDNLDDVLKNKDRILNYIEKAGLFHDVGKSKITTLINLQTRKLSDEEFGLIKNHPKAGIEVLKDDSYFKDYYDVILMHHKWYDGTDGYPIEVNNQSSIYKKAIDLVSIADSLDAATDIFGRNYTTPKSVDDVLLEFQSLKGSRYNPNLIQLISNDNELVSKLRQMTKDDRAMIYYYAVKELEER